jgi:hypothetical protein
MTILLTKFFLPNCGFCTDPKFKKDWDKLKEKYKDAVNEVDCSNNNPLCREIQGVPSIRYTLKNDKTFSVEHTGERTFDAISNIMEKLSK